MKKCWPLLARLLSGCSVFTVIEPGWVSVTDYCSVQPGIRWSQVQSGDTRYWTVDGRYLEAIRFSAAIAAGKPVMALSGDKKATLFRADMTENEEVEAIVAALSLEGAWQVTAQNLRPAGFGNTPGSRCEIGFLDSEGRAKESGVLAIIAGKSLCLVVYSVVRMHYYPATLGEHEHIVQPIRVNGAG